MHEHQLNRIERKLDALALAVAGIAALLARENDAALAVLTEKLRASAAALAESVAAAGTPAPPAVS